MKQGMKIVLLFLLGLFIAGCSMSKEPAEKAIKSAEGVFNAIKGEAVKYAAAETQAVEKAILAAKDKHDRNEYDAAFKLATELPDKINQLAAISGTRKGEWLKGWNAVSKELPALLDALQAQIEELSKRKKLPPGIDRAKIEEARAAQPALAQEWNEAKNAHAAGDLINAVTKAKAAREKTVEAMAALGMQVQEVTIQ